MAKRAGRKSVFRDKMIDGKLTGGRIHGVLSSRGRERFEAHRDKLGAIAIRPSSAVSDGDVVEYLARGVTETRRALKDSE
jgi:hypothetical protein